MAFTAQFNRLKVSTALIFMLFSQFGFIAPACCQNTGNWAALDQLIESKLPDLGGRAVMLVWKDGKLQYSRTFNELGKRQETVRQAIAKRRGLDREELVADFSENSRQRIASSSKWLSAALVMTFVDEGKLNLEDTIGKFLPLMTENGKGQIRIWQCLSHLTGIHQIGAEDAMKNNTATQGRNARDRQGGMGAMRSGNNNERRNSWPNMDAAMDSVAYEPMEGEPGKTFHYGNAGLQIAAAIVEKIGGKSFNELFLERIANPLGMTNTDFGNNPVPLAAGGAFSTPNDYMKFLLMLLQKGAHSGKQILSKASVEAMQVNRVTKDVKVIYTPAEAGTWGYGLGEWVAPTETGHDFVSSPGMFGSFPWIDNDKQYAAFLFVVNLKSKGRHELYHDLKLAVDKGLGY